MTRHRDLLILLVFAAAIMSPTVVFADDDDDDSQNVECYSALRALQKSGAEMLYTDDKLVEGIRYEPASSSGSSTSYRERETRIWRSGRELEFINTLGCSDGKMAVEGARSSDPNEPSTSFSPPLPWVPLPLRAGDSWSWDGTFKTEIFGDHSILPSKASGTVLGSEQVTMNDGTVVMTTHLQLELSIGKGEEQQRYRYDSWVMTEPHYRVVKRIIADLSYDQTVSYLAGKPGTGATQSGTTPDGEKKVIIIKAPVEKP